MKTDKEFWFKALLLLVLNGILFSFFRSELSFPTDTEHAYSPLAMHLLQGRGYELVPGQIYTHHPPLFSLLLAFIYKLTGIADLKNPVYPFAVIIFQTLSALLLFSISNEIFHKRAAWLSAALLTTHPLFAVLTATRYAWNVMPFFLVLFLLSLRLFQKFLNEKKLYWIAGSGFSLGLAALAWSGGVYYCLIGAGLLVWKMKSKFWIPVFVFLALYLIPVAGWSGYVYKESGKIIAGSSSFAPSVIDGMTRHEGSALRNYKTVERAAALKENGNLRTMKDVLSFLSSEFQKHLGDILSFMRHKWFRAWYGTDAEKQDKMILIIQIPYLLLGVYGLILAIKEKNSNIALLIAPILYFWLLGFCVLATVRYMIPALACMLVFTAYGIRNIWQRIVLR